MAVEFVAAVAGTSSASSSSAQVDFTGRSAGQFAVVQISRVTEIAAPTSVPSGWQLLAEHDPGSAIRIMAYWKVLEAGDIGAVQWTFANAGKTLAGALVYSGVDSGAPSYTKGTFLSALGTTLDLGSLASSEAWLCVLASCYRTGARTYDLSSEGLTERAEFGGLNPDVYQYVGDTNGGWAGGTFAPSTVTAFIDLDSYYRGGFVVELAAASDPAAAADLFLDGVWG